MVTYTPPVISTRASEWDLSYERSIRGLSSSNWQTTFAAIQNDDRFNDGDIITLRSGTYPISASIPVTKPCTIKGYGKAIIDTDVFIHMADLGTTPGVTFKDVEFDGPGNSTYNTSNTAIRAIGESAANLSDGLTVEGCTFRNIAFECIQATFFERVTVIKNTFENSYVRAGLMNRSNRHVKFNKNWVYPPTSGAGNPGNNCYPVAFSRDSTIGIVEQPVTEHWECVGNHFFGNPFWEIIDTHAGRHGIVAGNFIYGGGPLGPGAIAIVSSSDTLGVSTYGPKFIRVEGNIISSGVADGTAAPGIVVDGAGAGTAGVFVDLAEMISVQGNIVVGHGKQNTGTDGGLVAAYTAGCTFKDNLFFECSPHGMNLNHDNYECNTGLTSRSHWSTDLTNPSALLINSFYNTGLLDEIIRSTGTKVATNVNSRGIQVPSSQVPATHNSALLLGTNKISGSNAINSAVAMRPGGMLKFGFGNLEGSRGLGADGVAGNLVQTYNTTSLTLPLAPTATDVANFVNALVDILQQTGRLE